MVNIRRIIAIGCRINRRSIGGLTYHSIFHSVTEVAGEHTTVLELRVAKADLGTVIGKKGRNAQAIRTILSAAAGKTCRRYLLEIVE